MSSAADKGRCLILCFDGTSNQYDETNTNVVKFFSLLKKEEPEKQLVYYQAGIGTYTNPGIWNHFVAEVSKIADLAVAWYLEAHVMSGYRFLAKHYRTGDKICLFGFSRGAYTARALAGMLHKVGLLPPDNEEQVPFAYRMYRREDAKATEQALGFKAAFCRSVTIEFMGVWDTVSSVGLIIPRHLPFSSSTSLVRVFRHAVSLDEHRAKFQINLWHRNAPNPSEAKKDPERGSGVVDEMSPRLGAVGLERSGGTPRWEGSKKATDIEEVWFAGCHADVGGGSVLDTTLHSLSAITLRWMVRECAIAQSGILFDNDALRRAGIPQDSFRVSSPFKGFKRKHQGSPLPVTIIEHLGEEQQGIGEVMGEGGLGFFKGDGLDPRPPSGLSMEHPLPHPQPTFYGEESPVQSLPPLVNEPGVDDESDKPFASPESAIVPLETSQSASGVTGLSPRLFGFGLLRPRSAKAPSNMAKSTREVRSDGSDGHMAGDHYRMSSRELDDADALSPLYDELKLQPVWWILEFIPFVRATQDKDGNWKRTIRMNFFRSREIPTGKRIKVHSSVKTRMEAGIGYAPRARWTVEPEWVE